ncbi:MAG: hypothetical protein EPN94_01870 [Nitrospirae bacterium]|nr:MAG: hypothetical protein EPN94_01870 [Nitrospirota bacterium]
MLVGYNNNVTYKGKVYHVQTEDSGLKNPIIVTLLYFKGTILASKKTNYSHLIGNKDIKESVRELMKEQHKAILKELIAGKHTAEVQAEVKETGADVGKPEIQSAASGNISEPGAKGAADKTKTLDDILLDYIIKREKSK